MLEKPVIAVVDDDEPVRQALVALLVPTATVTVRP